MGKNALYIIVAGVAIILFGTSAYLLGQNQKLISQESKTEVTPAPTIPIPPTLEPTATTSASKKRDEPAMVVEMSPNLPSQDISQLKKRIVDPYVDYFKDTHKNDALVSFAVSLNTGAGQDQYPYKAQALTANGINEGFLISKTSGQIGWWYPDCLVKCEFTESFSSKYPEIAKKVE